MPLFPNEIPTAEQSQAMHDRAQGAREVAAAYRQTCDDRDDGTPADPQTDGGLNLQIAALVEALEEAQAALIKIRQCSIAGCEHGYGKPELWADDLFRSHGDVAAALKRIDSALASVRCLKP